MSLTGHNMRRRVCEMKDKLAEKLGDVADKAAEKLSDVLDVVDEVKTDILEKISTKEDAPEGGDVSVETVVKTRKSRKSAEE